MPVGPKRASWPNPGFKLAQEGHLGQIKLGLRGVSWPNPGFKLGPKQASCPNPGFKLRPREGILAESGLQVGPKRGILAEPRFQVVVKRGLLAESRFQVVVKRGILAESRSQAGPNRGILAESRFQVPRGASWPKPGFKLGPGGGILAESRFQVGPKRGILAEPRFQVGLKRGIFAESRFQVVAAHHMILHSGHVVPHSEDPVVRRDATPQDHVFSPANPRFFPPVALVVIAGGSGLDDGLAPTAAPTTRRSAADTEAGSTDSGDVGPDGDWMSNRLGPKKDVGWYIPGKDPLIFLWMVAEMVARRRKSRVRRRWSFHSLWGCPTKRGVWSRRRWLRSSPSRKVKLARLDDRVDPDDKDKDRPKGKSKGKGRKPCWSWQAGTGCRFGAACLFQHDPLEPCGSSERLKTGCPYAGQGGGGGAPGNGGGKNELRQGRDFDRPAGGHKGKGKGGEDPSAKKLEADGGMGESSTAVSSGQGVGSSSTAAPTSSPAAPPLPHRHHRSRSSIRRRQRCGSLCGLPKRWPPTLQGPAGHSPK